MARRKRHNWQDPVAVVTVLGLIAWAYAARHEWRDMAILIGIDLIVLGNYLAFGHPHRCKEPVVSRPGGRCRNKAYGLLLGCPGVHRWYRLRRLFSRTDEPAATAWHQPAPGGRTRRTTTAVPADGPRLEARVTFWCTVISTVAGVLSLVVGVVGVIAE